MSFNELRQQPNIGSVDSQSYLDSRANVLLAPQGQKGLSGFLFDVPSGETLTLTADITDHFTENNSFLHDHKTIKPAQISISGFVGELVFRGGNAAERATQDIQNRLETVEAYAGDFTPGAVQIAQNAVSQVRNAASAIDTTVQKTQNLVVAFEGEGPEQTAQQAAYKKLEALFRSDSLLSLQTPWKYFDNLMIMSLGFTQDDQTKELTDIQIQLKEIRVSEVKVVEYDRSQFEAREEVQAADEQDQGIVQGEERDSSFLFQVFGGQ